MEIGKQDLRSFIHDLGWSWIGVGAALAMDFCFYILVGRFLGPELFGVFGVFMAIYYIFIGPASHALELTAKKIAAEGRKPVSCLLLPTLKLGAAVSGLFILFSPLTAHVFSLSMTDLLVFSLIFPLGYALAVLTGTVQGRKNFRAYAYYEIVSSTVKFSAIVLVILGFGVAGAIVAPVLEIFAGFTVLAVIAGLKLSQESFTDRSLMWHSGLFILAVYSAFSIDILVLKIFMRPEQVGLYNSVATLGKAVFFGSVAVNRAVFPEFVRKPGDRKKYLKIAFALVLSGGVFATGFMAFLGEWFIGLAYGKEYIAAASFAPLYMIFITGVSIVALFGNYHLSKESDLNWVLILPLLEIIGLLAFHETILNVLYALIFAVLTTVIVLGVPIFRD